MEELFERYLEDESATVEAGFKLAKNIEHGMVLYLDGVLGAGKTTFCRGILQAFGHSGAVKSPTYTLVEPYDLAEKKVFHFDLYRLGDPEELEYMGIRDYFQPQHICLVEWPEKGRGFLPEADLIAKVLPKGSGRSLTVSSGSERGRDIIGRL